MMPLGRFLGASWGSPGTALGQLGALFGRLGRVLRRLGSVLGHLGGVLARLGVVWAETEPPGGDRPIQGDASRNLDFGNSGLEFRAQSRAKRLVEGVARRGGPYIIQIYYPTARGPGTPNVVCDARWRIFVREGLPKSAPDGVEKRCDLRCLFTHVWNSNRGFSLPSVEDRGRPPDPPVWASTPSRVGRYTSFCG